MYKNSAAKKWATIIKLKENDFVDGGKKPIHHFCSSRQWVSILCLAVIENEKSKMYVPVIELAPSPFRIAMYLEVMLLFRDFFSLTNLMLFLFLERRKHLSEIRFFHLSLVNFFCSYFDIESYKCTVFSRFGRLSNIVTKPSRCEFKVCYDRGSFISSNTLNAFHGLCQNVLLIGNNNSSSSSKRSVNFIFIQFSDETWTRYWIFFSIILSSKQEKRMQNNKMKM